MPNVHITPRAPLNHWNCCRSLRGTEIDWLITNGVPYLSLARDEDGGGFALVAADVTFYGAGDAKFSFAEEVNGEATKPALIAVARDVHGDPSDLIAIQPRTGAVASWLGVAALLGEHELSTVRFEEKPIYVHQDGLGWLRAGRAGLVVVDIGQARWLLHDQPLAVSDRQFARALAHSLTLRPRMVAVRPAVSDDGKAA